MTEQYVSSDTRTNLRSLLSLPPYQQEGSIGPENTAHKEWQQQINIAGVAALIRSAPPPAHRHQPSNANRLRT